jgi:transcriptional regulator with XRE-family HTH domain
MSLTRLTADELGRRIKAARILRNLEQRDLNELFEQDGVGRSAGFLERGSPRAPLTRARLDSLVRHLHVPEAWFVNPDIDETIWGPPDTRPAEDLAAVSRDLAELRDAIDTVVRRLGPGSE